MTPLTEDILGDFGTEHEQVQLLRQTQLQLLSLVLHSPLPLVGFFSSNIP
jgi:hypothetical protein